MEPAGTVAGTRHVAAMRAERPNESDVVMSEGVRTESKETDMLKRLMITTALSGLLAGSALAQGAPAPDAKPATPPAATAPAPNAYSTRIANPPAQLGGVSHTKVQQATATRVGEHPDPDFQIDRFQK